MLSIQKHNIYLLQQEVRRALAGQFLVVGLVVPILATRGPREWPMGWTARRRSSSSDRQNTVRHLIQGSDLMCHLESTVFLK
jgi:hypothetical protein